MSADARLFSCHYMNHTVTRRYLLEWRATNRKTGQVSDLAPLVAWLVELVYHHRLCRQLMKLNGYIEQI